VTVNSIGEGKIMPGTGQARFKCQYTAIVMKPFKGEVVDGKVVNVNKVSFEIVLKLTCRWASSRKSVRSRSSSRRM